MPMEGGRRCVRCGEDKPRSQFDGRGVARPNEIFPYCKPCRREHDKTRLAAIRNEALAVYGDSRCRCCGIAEKVFLCLDHVNNNGNVERATLSHSQGGGVQFYARLKRMGWPAGYQVLCYNCNMAKHLIGECPHKNLLLAARVNVNSSRSDREDSRLESWAANQFQDGVTVNTSDFGSEESRLES